MRCNMMIDEVSVPLRGYGFEMYTDLILAGFIQIVSVPLRGYGFEINPKRKWNVPNKSCFRPLAGIWF